MNPHPLSRPKGKPVPSNFPQVPLPRAIPALVTHQYAARDILELPLKWNQRLHILEAKGEWWYIARTMDGKEGWVPSSYVRLLATPQNVDMRDFFTNWLAKVDETFRRPEPGESKPKIDQHSFPWLPPEVCACEEAGCWLRKQEKGLGACVHDVEALLRGSPDYGAAWLWRMSLGWHPDRFVKRFKEAFKEEGVRAVGEMFGILTELAGREREKEAKMKKKEESENIKVVF